MTFCQRIFFVLVIVSWGGDCRSAEPAPSNPRPPPLATAKLAPALRTAAEHEGIKLFFTDRSGDAPKRGDSVVAWVGTDDGKKVRQWLIELRRDVATPREEKYWEKRVKTKYLSWGPVITFESKAEALQLWIAGPVDMSESPDAEGPVRTKRIRVSIPGDYLRLGLDESARVSMHVARRLLQAKKAGREIQMGNIYSLDTPIKSENVEYAKPVAEEIGYTPEMARAWVGGYVALQSFYDVINDVSELREIAEIAVDKPSFWKLPKTMFGTRFKTWVGDQNTRAVDPVKMGLLAVGSEAYDVPYRMSFGDDAMVFGEMVVTAPNPPLDVSAGILGVVGVNPRDLNRKVHLVLISSNRGG